MYVTRQLSQLRSSPEMLARRLEGPNSGCLVIQDEESEVYSCFGLCKRRTLSELPFPQNKELIAQYVVSTGQSAYVQTDEVFLIPVLDQPLSSNRYYAVVAHGKHIGEAITCSREEDKVTCCFCRCVKDKKPKPLEPGDVYQQIKITPYEGCCSSKGEFCASSVPPDGFPPSVFQQTGWRIETKTAENCKLESAEGIDSEARDRLPGFDFPVSQRSSEPRVVGKWYCPFVFVKEGTLRDQVKKSLYYQVILEQRWEQIFTCRRGSHHNRGKSVAIDALIEKEEAFVGGSKARWDEKPAVDGVIWFAAMGEERRVGLRSEVVQRMRWEEERGGWVSGGDRQVRINRVEESKEGLEWSEFGLYVVVERFSLRRMDGSVAMCWDFRHLEKTMSKWE